MAYIREINVHILVHLHVYLSCTVGDKSTYRQQTEVKPQNVFFQKLLHNHVVP